MWIRSSPPTYAKASVGRPAPLQGGEGRELGEELVLNDNYR